MATAAAGRAATLKKPTGMPGNVVHNSNSSRMAAVLASLQPGSTLTSLMSTVENPMFVGGKGRHGGCSDGDTLGPRTG
jgi:hypothetical protein